MKKILVVLLILAVAGGVFAQQGTWSLSSSGGVGARINFDPDPAHDGDVALIRGTNYQRPYRQYTQIFGQLGLNYSRGTLGVGLNFSTEGDILGSATINGENYTFVVSSNMNEWFAPFVNEQNNVYTLNGGGEGQSNRKFVNRLWGQYKMLNDLVSLEVAYRSRDTELWVSDKTATIDKANFQLPYTYNWTQNATTHNWEVRKTPKDRVYRIYGGDASLHNYSHEAPSQAFFNETGHTFSKVDRGNYLLGNVSTGGLQLGLMVPNFFPTTYTSGGEGSWPPATNGINPWEGQTPGFTNFSAGKWSQGVNFVDEVLMQSIFGAKFSMHPIEVAAQLKFQDYGIYFGGKFFAGPITVGLSFMGIMGKVQMNSVLADKDGNNYAPQLILSDAGFSSGAFGHIYNASVSKFGGRVDYNGGSFGAGIAGFWGKQGGSLGAIDADGITTGSGLTSALSIIGIEPVFFINAIPSHLRFTLSAGFYFETYTGPDTSNIVSDVRATYWALQPEISWNFRGTGAVGGYHGMNTGMFFRYRIVSNTVNALDLAFVFGL